MTWTFNTNAPYHQQDTDYYCGGACAQMILDSIGAGIISQDTLYNSNHSHNTVGGWATDPDGLRYTLNAYGNAYGKYFARYVSDTELAGTEQIIHTLWQYQVAPAALVLGCGHWIVIRGVSTDVEPAPGNSYSINGFWVNNPWPPTPQPGPPPPHADGTDGCGSGGMRGLGNEYAAYSSMWQSTYFTGCDVWGVGHSQFASVGDPTPPKLGTLVNKREPFEFRGERLLAHEEVVELAKRAIEQHGLQENELFAKVLGGGRWHAPVLVQRLDLLDTYYYLVEIGNGDSANAVLAVDALVGEFQGGHVFDEPMEPLMVRRRELEERVSLRPIEWPEGEGRIILRPEAYCLYPALVWKPCRESRSPYYPFHMITAGAAHVYVGMDGQVFTALHPMGLGG